MVDAPDLKLSEVSEQLRLNPETVRRWLASGKLRGYRLGGKRAGWRISEADLQHFVAEQRSQGEQR